MAASDTPDQNRLKATKKRHDAAGSKFPVISGEETGVVGKKRVRPAAGGRKTRSQHAEVPVSAHRTKRRVSQNRAQQECPKDAAFDKIDGSAELASKTGVSSGDGGTASFAAAKAAPKGSRRRADLDRARSSAAMFATGSVESSNTVRMAERRADEEDSFLDSNGSSEEISEHEEDETGTAWDGPFAIARQMANGVHRARRRRQRAAAGLHEPGEQTEDEPPSLRWNPIPAERASYIRPQPIATLEAMATDTLCRHFDALSAIGAVPTSVRKKVAQALAIRGELDSRNLKVLLDDGCDGSLGWDKLELSDCCKIEEAALIDVLSPLPPDRLVAFALRNCGRCFGDAAAAALAACAGNLRVLELHGAYRLYDDALNRLLAATSLLEEVSLQHCSELNVSSMSALSEQCPELQKLSIRGCTHLCTGGDANESLALQPLSSKQMPCLRSLDLSNIPELAAEDVAALVIKHGPTLTELRLLGCKKLDENALTAVGLHCKKLRIFSYEYTSENSADLEPPELQCKAEAINAAVARLGDACGKTFEELALWNLGLLRDRAVITLSECCRYCCITDCHYLVASWFAYFRTDASDLSAFVLSSGGALRALSLNGASIITDRAVLSVAHHCAKGLTELDLSWCQRLTDEGLGLLADCCKSLHTLRLWGCNRCEGRALHSTRVLHST